MKLSIYIYFLLALISCGTTSQVDSGSVKKHIEIEDERVDLIVFGFKTTDVSELMYHSKFIENNIILSTKGRGIDVPVRTCTYSFINTVNDTMKLECKHLGNGSNYYLDKILFKKGHYVLNILDTNKQELKGENLFKENPNLKKIRVNYLPYFAEKRVIKQLKEIPFHYYEIGEGGVTLKEVEKK